MCCLMVVMFLSVPTGINMIVSVILFAMGFSEGVGNAQTERPAS